MKGRIVPFSREIGIMGGRVNVLGSSGLVGYDASASGMRSVSWVDAGYVYVPLADVQDLIDQYAAYVRGQEERAP